MIDAGEVMRERMTLLADGTFIWGGDTLADVLPVAGPDTWSAPDIGPIWAEVVAWAPDVPSRWHLEAGDVPILGWAAWERARAEGTALTLHPTPAAWLAAGGQGICVLRWNFDPAAVFAGVGELRCASGAVERRLQAEIGRWRDFQILGPRHAA